MINLIPQNKKYKNGDTLPLTLIPIYEKGKPVEFNDFQWWAPTSKWDQWLRSNPRSWQAESEDHGEIGNEKLYEFFVETRQINPFVVGFDEFNSILEDNSEQQTNPNQDQKGNPQAVQVATPEKITSGQKKNYPKFVFAYNKLKKAGKIDEEMGQNYLKKGNTYALIADLISANSSPSKESRQAYKMKIVSSYKESCLAFCEEAIPSGKVPDNSPGGGENFFKSIADWTMGITAAGITGLAVWGTYTGLKSIATRLFFKKAVAAVVETTVETETTKAFAGLSASAGTGALVVGAAIVIYQVTQRLINWTSKNQAPRLSEIEDEGWARDSFMPGTIEDGELITICWTQSSGNNWFTDLLWNEDTRTTMDLVKLGDFNGRSIFILIKINSKEYEAVLKSKEMILISFDEGAKVKRGWLDNDDLEFELITIDKKNAKSTIPLSFQGVCLWEDFLSEYNGSDDSFVGVPENAPDEYTFHFKYGKSNRDINVTGSLIKNIDSVEGMEDIFKAEGSKNESEEEKYDHLIELLAESSGVFSFSDFSKITDGDFIPTFEEEKVSSPGSSKTSSSGATGGQTTNEEDELPTKTTRVAAYDVKSIEYADLGLQGQDLPKLLTFIVPNNYLEAEDQESIEIEPIQEIKVKSPKKGTVIVESEPVPDPIPPGATGEEIQGGVPVKVTKDEVINVYRDRPEVLNKLGIKDVEKIKDKDRKDEINFLDMITPEEKEKLGISDWGFLKRIKIYRDGKTKEPITVKFRSRLNRKKFQSSDENFDTALRVAERVQAGYQNVDKEDEETEKK